MQQGESDSTMRSAEVIKRVSTTRRMKLGALACMKKLLEKFLCKKPKPAEKST